MAALQAGVVPRGPLARGLLVLLLVVVVVPRVELLRLDRPVRRHLLEKGLVWVWG
jgi:hypothetical protein